MLRWPTNTWRAVRFKREPIIVQSYDTPQAVLIPYEEYADYSEWRTGRAQRKAWLAELRAIAEEVSDRAALSDEQAAALIQEAKRG